MSDLAAWKVRGSVRTLSSEHAEWDLEKSEWKKAWGLRMAAFRPDGQFSESAHHNSDGSIARAVHLYDEDGRLVEAQWWTDDGPKKRVRYSYDEAGRPAAATELSGDGTARDVETYQYDAEGRKTKVHAFGPQQMAVNVMHSIEGSDHSYAAPGATASTTVYDNRDRPVEIAFHDANAALVLRVDLSRDGNGRVVTEVARTGGDLPWPGLSPEQVSVDEGGEQVALIAAAFRDQAFSAVTYQYDSGGRLIARRRKIGNLCEERDSFAYNDANDPITETSENRSREVFIDENRAVRYKENDPHVQHSRYEYRYDARGNWTERTVWFRLSSQADFQRSNIERRIITYYE